MRAERDDLQAALKLARLDTRVAAADAALAVAEKEAQLRHFREAFREKDARLKKTDDVSKAYARALEAERDAAAKLRAAGVAKGQAAESKILAVREEAEKKVNEAERVRRKAERALGEIKRELDEARKQLDGKDDEVRRLKDALKATEILVRRMEKEKGVWQQRMDTDVQRAVKDAEELVLRKEKAWEAKETKWKEKEKAWKDKDKRERQDVAVWKDKFETEARNGRQNETKVKRLEDRLARLETESEAEKEKTRCLEREGEELKLQLQRLQEIHSAEYTLPPTSLPREDFSALLSPAPLASSRHGSSGRRSRVATPTRGPALRNSPLPRQRADDSASESRSRFTDSLPFELDDEDELLREDDVEDRDFETGTPVQKGSAKSKARAKRRPAGTPKAKGGAMKRKRRTEAVANLRDHDGTDTDDIRTEPGAMNEPESAGTTGAKRRKKSSPAVKRRKVPATKAAKAQGTSPVGVVERWAGGRELRRRRPVSYDYDKDERDIVGKSPGYEVDYKALRRRPGKLAGSRVAQVLDFEEEVELEDEGVVAVAAKIRESVERRRRARQTVRKTVGRG